MKRAVFGDIHFGNHGGSDTYNQDCIDFIDWMLETCIKEQVDDIVFLGDWFDDRFRVDLATHSIADKCLRKLSSKFPITMIVGNHDMLYKDRRTVHSLECYKDWENVTIVDDIMVDGDYTYVPFLVGDEYYNVPMMDTPIIFGHFEIPTFLTNKYRAFEGDGLDPEEMNTMAKYVFSGHFHMRQHKVNTSGVRFQYIGSPFPQNFNDVDDDKRGFMILDGTDKFTFHDWEDCPFYTRLSVDEIVDIIENPEDFDLSKTVVEIKNTDTTISHADMMAIREKGDELFREVRWKNVSTNTDDDEEDIVIDEHESIEDIIIKQLKTIVSRDDGIDPDLLVELFQSC